MTNINLIDVLQKNSGLDVKEYVAQKDKIHVIQELAEIDFLRDGKPSSNNPIYMAAYQLASAMYNELEGNAEIKRI